MRDRFVFALIAALFGQSYWVPSVVGQETATSQQATPTQPVPSPASPDAPGLAEPTKDPVAEQDPRSRIVTLEFREQPWLPALQWLAGELKLNLDWQSLPEGQFSLHSERTFTLADAEDMMNMQLLARGYTLLKREEVLRVVPLKDIDITLVPRVEAAELEKLKRHDFVRVSLPLEWMIAEEAATEFQPLLSPYGKLSPMRSTNRLEVMDAVVNLREIYRLLAKAEATDARRERVAEFPLKYRTADEVAVKVRQLLGLPPESSSSPAVQTQLDIEQARFKAEAVKQIGADAKDLIKEKRPDVFITVNDKENSILVNAPPNKMEIVRQAVEALDKPLPERDSMWETVNKVKVHEVEGFDPVTVTGLLTSLQAKGNLAKDARIQYEAAYNRIIAFASPEDQLTIMQLIDSFRAKRRSATVIPLGSMDANYAVKAVQLVLKNPIRPPSAPGVASDGQFQIEADPDHDRLLLWATPDEVKEVQEFLQSLGETQSERSLASGSNVEVLKLNGESLKNVLERFEDIWKDLSDAPLVVDADLTRVSSPENSSEKAGVKSGAPAEIPDVKSEAIPIGQSIDGEVRKASFVVSHQQPEASVAGENDGSRDANDRDAERKSQEPNKRSAATDSAIPPVRLVEGENGELIILSKDPAAARSAKQLLEKILPEPSPITTIELKYSQAAFVRKQVETSLAEEQKTSTLPKLATPEKPMKFDVDTRTNRLIIQNASEKQIKRVKQLVEALDQPLPTNDRLARQQRIYRFKHRKAAEVAVIVKDVYRDLLSINDRVFADKEGKGPVGYNQNLAATQSSPEYQGLLSVAADTESNLLVVSAPSYLIEDVMKLVESVDSKNDGDSVMITSIPDGAKDAQIRDALSRILNSRRRRE